MFDPALRTALPCRQVDGAGVPTPPWREAAYRAADQSVTCQPSFGLMVAQPGPSSLARPGR